MSYEKLSVNEIMNLHGGISVEECWLVSTAHICYLCMKRLLILVFLSLFCLNSFAQELQMVVQYDLKKVLSISRGDYWKPQTFFLEIGQDSVQFFSMKSWSHRYNSKDPEYKAKRDQMFQLAFEKMSSGQSRPGEFAQSFPTMGEYQVITYYLNNPAFLKVYDKLDSEYFWYPDSVELDWELGEETKIVLDYECYKATTKFRGRVWHAWFAPEIPLSLGPWKLSGLPGLILEAYDTDRQYIYEAKGLEQGGEFHDTSIYYQEPIKETTFEKFAKSKLRSEVVGGFISLSIGSPSTGNDTDQNYSEDNPKPREILEW